MLYSQAQSTKMIFEGPIGYEFLQRKCRPWLRRGNIWTTYFNLLCFLHPCISWSPMVLNLSMNGVDNFLTALCFILNSYIDQIPVCRISVYIVWSIYVLLERSVAETTSRGSIHPGSPALSVTCRWFDVLGIWEKPLQPGGRIQTMTRSPAIGAPGESQHDTANIRAEPGCRSMPGNRDSLISTGWRSPRLNPTKFSSGLE
jgi:hypothetical protein